MIRGHLARFDGPDICETTLKIPSWLEASDVIAVAVCTADHAAPTLERLIRDDSGLHSYRPEAAKIRTHQVVSLTWFSGP
jgi:hypothetical protein